MCTRWRTEFSCGCRLPTTIERCDKPTCDRLSKIKREVDEDCDDCFAKAENCTRGRDGFGPHARRIRKEQQKLRQAQEGHTVTTVQGRDHMGTSVSDPVGPWLDSLPDEHKWKKNSRRGKADEEWVREHERRQRRGVPGASSTISSVVHERLGTDGGDHGLHRELEKLSISKRVLDDREQHRSNRREWDRVLRRRRTDEYAEPEWGLVEHRPHRERRSSHHSGRQDHYGRLVYDTGVGGPINPHHYDLTTTQVFYNFEQPYSPPFSSSHSPPASPYGSPYSHGSAYSYGGSWSHASPAAYTHGY